MESKNVTLAVAAVAAVVVIGVIVRARRQPVDAPESPALSERGGVQRTVRSQRTKLRRAVPQALGDPSAQQPAAAAVPRAGTESQQQRGERVPAPAAGVAGGPAAGTAPDDAPPEDIPSLGHMALTDTNPVRRIEAIHLLSGTEDPKAIPYLRQALSDPDPNVRFAIVKSLAEVDFTVDESMALLSPVVTQDAAPENRIEALRVLSEIDAERVVAVAQQALNDPDEDVRSLAQAIVGSDEADSADDRE